MFFLTNLLDYLPVYLKEYKILSNILKTQTIYLEDMEKDLLFLIENSFVITASEEGVDRFEKMLSIKPFSSDTLEVRKQRILNKLGAKLPYTLETLKEKIEAVIGQNYEVCINYESFCFSIISTVDQLEKGKLIEEILDEYIPANILISSITNFFYEIYMNIYYRNVFTHTKKYKIR